MSVVAARTAVSTGLPHSSSSIVVDDAVVVAAAVGAVAARTLPTAAVMVSYCFGCFHVVRLSKQWRLPRLMPLPEGRGLLRTGLRSFGAPTARTANNNECCFRLFCCRYCFLDFYYCCCRCSAGHRTLPSACGDLLRVPWHLPSWTSCPPRLDYSR